MAQQTFTAGQVLTAAQLTTLQTNDFNQTVSTKTANYVLVAADKGTRIVMNSATATTITVNTSLFAAGDTLNVLNIGAGTCTITAGTATVSGPNLALPQNGGGTLYFTSPSASNFQANGIRVPFAMECGVTAMTPIVLGSTTSTATITFTVGRFTATPVLTANTNNAFNSVFWVVSIRSTSAASYSIAAGGPSSPGSAGLDCYWHAIQM